MAFTLINGGAHKTVATLEQANNLKAFGWVLTGGSAGDTTLLGEFPNTLGVSSKSVNPAFRGNGIPAYPAENLEYVMAKSEPEMTADQYELMVETIGGGKTNSASVYTKIVAVTALPAEPVETYVYMLTVADSTHAVGMWISNSSDWLAYTPGMVFDVNYGADTEIALLATYVSSAAFAPLPIATANTKSAIEAIILAELQTVVNAGATKDYTVSFVGSAYSTSTGVWTGKVKVTNDTNALDTVTDAANRTFLFGSFVAMKLVTDVAISTVPNGTTNTIAPIKEAVLVLANAAISAMSGYVVTIAAAPVCTYDTGTGAMACKFTVTETANAAVNVFTDATARALTIVIAEA